MAEQGAAFVTEAIRRGLLCAMLAVVNPDERVPRSEERSKRMSMRGSAGGSEVIFNRLAAPPLQQAGGSLGRQKLCTRPRRCRSLPCAGEEEQKQKHHLERWWSPVVFAHLAEPFPPELAPGASRWLPGF